MPERVTFIHAADLHLDAPFQGVEAADERVNGALVEATYEAWDRVVETALDRKVDFVVVAGDAYNSRDKSLRAQLRFHASLRRLADAGIPVFIAQGNHDPASGWSAELELPEGVAYFPTDRVGRFEVTVDGEFACAVYGRGYGKAAETSNLARSFERSAEDPLAVGVLHANVGGNTDHEPYAPCSVDDLRASGMDYWALGHIHKPGTLATDPVIAYSGSPQGLNPKEDGAHGCLFVELTEAGARTEFVETASVLWHRGVVDVADCDDISAVRLALVDACGPLREQADRPVIARFELVGRTQARALLARPGVLPQLVDDVRAEQLGESPWLWIDRVRDLTRAPIDLDQVRKGADFAADLENVADGLAANEDDTRRLIDELAGQLSATLGGYAPAEEPAALLVRARDICLDLLLAGEDEG